MKNMNRKSEIWVSVIIYTLVAVLALTLILSTGIPIINEIKDRSAFSKVKEIMLDLDKHITDIAAQGPGTQSSVSFEIKDGELRFSDNQIIWEIETDSKIISPKTSQVIGNLIISSNANVKAFTLNDSFLMQSSIKNDTFSVKIARIGSEESPAVFNTSDIVQYISYNGDMMTNNFVFSLNSNASSLNGTGYTKMVPSGNNTNLGKAKVIAHMDSEFGTYDMEFILESHADYLKVKIKNFKPKD
jgi:hypothetical protein